MQVIQQTHKEKMTMYMKFPKKKLAEMIINCNDILDNVLPEVRYDIVNDIKQLINQKENKIMTKEEFIKKWKKPHTQIVGMMDELDNLIAQVISKHDAGLIKEIEALKTFEDVGDYMRAINDVLEIIIKEGGEG